MTGAARRRGGDGNNADQIRKAGQGGRTAAPSRRRAAAGEDGGKIQSLKRASAILDAVARRPGGIGLSQISAEVGLHSSTAFHLIQTLVSLGFLAQLPDSRRYRIGTRLFALAASALDETVLLALAAPILERLSGDTGYASHLAVRSKQEIVVIARTAATGLLQLAGHPGATRPAHATAIGKMLLAAMPPDELDRLLKTLPLPAFTPQTITDARALRREIEASGARGSPMTIASSTATCAASPCPFSISPAAAQPPWASPDRPGASCPRLWKAGEAARGLPRRSYPRNLAARRNVGCNRAVARIAPICASPRSDTGASVQRAAACCTYVAAHTSASAGIRTSFPVISSKPRQVIS